MELIWSNIMLSASTFETNNALYIYLPLFLNNALPIELIDIR